MSDQGNEEDLPTNRHSMISTIASMSMENVGEDKKFNSFDGICTSQPVQSLASVSYLMEEEEIEELEEVREVGEMEGL